MVNKLKGPSKEASIPLGREKKAITGDGMEGGRDLGGKVDREGKRGTRSGIGRGNRTEVLRASRKNGNRQPRDVE